MDPFSIIRIYVDWDDRSKLIEWELKSDFCPVSGTLNFYVESARSLEDWVRLNPSSPVVNDNSYVDTDVYNYDLKNNLYYRVILEKDGVTYTSKPYNILSGLSTYEYKIKQTIMKKELERYKKEVAGTEGYLLKRRVWGESCSSCKDYDLDAVINARCSICYGTGIVGGYFNGLPYTVVFNPGVTDQEEMKQGFALEDVWASQVRCIAYPVIAPYDMWVSRYSNRRYIFRKVQTVAELRSIPIIYQAAVMEVMPSRIEFEVPIEDNSIEADTPEDWRTALTPDY